MTHKTLITLIILLFVFGVFFIGSKSAMGYGPGGVYCRGPADCFQANCVPSGWCPDDHPGKNVYCKSTGLNCGQYTSDCSSDIEDCGYSDIIIVPSCDYWTNNYQCNGNTTQREYLDINCNSVWYDWENCGSDYWTDNYRCTGYRVQREYLYQGCDNGSCYSYGALSDWQYCDADHWTDNYRCSGTIQQREYWYAGCRMDWGGCFSFSADWYNWNACPYCCSGGSCTGSCSPGTTQPCAGGTQACSASCSWESCVLSNHAPTATNLLVTNSSFCAVAPPYFFSWTYSDSDSDTESRFDFQVDNNSNFSSPEVDRSVINPPSTTNTQAIVLATAQGLDNITYNTTYYWRVRVYDEHNLASNWVTGSSFITPAHHYPNPDFAWKPTTPNVNETVNLTNASQCWNVCSAYQWTMTGGTPTSATTTNATTKYSTLGLKNITLQVTDSDGYICSKTQSIRVNYPLPAWREIRPF